MQTDVTCYHANDTTKFHDFRTNFHPTFPGNLFAECCFLSYSKVHNAKYLPTCRLLWSLKLLVLQIRGHKCQSVTDFSCQCAKPWNNYALNDYHNYPAMHDTTKQNQHQNPSTFAQILMSVQSLHSPQNPCCHKQVIIYCHGYNN